jgi:hypothetical protein
VPICTGSTAHAPLLQVTKLLLLKETLVLVQPVAPCVKFGEPVLLIVVDSVEGVTPTKAHASGGAHRLTSSAIAKRACKIFGEFIQYQGNKDDINIFSLTCRHLFGNILIMT